MTHHEHVALIFGQRGKRIDQIVARSRLRNRGTPIAAGRPDLLDRHEAILAHVIDGDVASDTQQPCKEWHVSLLILANHRHQLGKDLVRDVLGLVVVLNDAAHVSMNVVGIASVEKAERITIPGLSTSDRARHQPHVSAIRRGRLCRPWPPGQLDLCFVPCNSHGCLRFKRDFLARDDSAQANRSAVVLSFKIQFEIC